MPFCHNAVYHGLLLRQLPGGCRRALDVGCGTGAFARRLARYGVEVDAVDPSADVLARARDLSAQIWAPGTIRWRRADATTLDLPADHYDFISCVASLHHMPFSTVTALRAALAPDGVLVILGLYREASVPDYLTSLAAVPVNAAARLAFALADRTQPDWNGRRNGVAAPVAAPDMTLDEVRETAGELLPGAVVRRLLFWRYLLVYRNDKSFD